MNPRRFLMSGLTLSLAGLIFSREPGWWPAWGALSVIAVASLAFAGWDGIVKRQRVDSGGSGS